MSHLRNWQTWLPRLLIVVVLLLAAQFAMGLVARTKVIRSTEAWTGGRVAVGHARVSLVNRQLILRDLSVADPRRPTTNLFLADRCQLDLAAWPLLRKRIVVERGVISGLRFVVPRCENGAPPSSPPPHRPSGSRRRRPRERAGGPWDRGVAPTPRARRCSPEGSSCSRSRPCSGALRSAAERGGSRQGREGRPCRPRFKRARRGVDEGLSPRPG